jgi:AAHS family 4-hydroxybenzoate transporter-like MFS transporter
MVARHVRTRADAVGSIRTVELSEFPLTVNSSCFDDRSFTLFRYGVVLLCGLVMFLDGFNTQAISYIAPYLASEWGLTRAHFGPIFSASLIGLLIGYLAVAPLADRYGHRRLIVLSTLLFGMATLLSAFASGLGDLLALRLVTGIGLGACVPSLVALTAEFSPAPVQATSILTIYAGYSLGFVGAGIASGWLIPNFGWRSLFEFAAGVTFLVVWALLERLPESPEFLLRVGPNATPGRASLPKFDLTVAVDPVLASKALRLPARLRNLLVPGDVWTTLLLWVVFAINLGAFYATQSWLPTLLTDRGYAGSVVVTATALTTAGGIAIVPLVGPAMDRLGAFRSLAMLYLVGFLFVAAVGVSLEKPLWTLYGAAFLAGCVVSGGQKSAIALGALLYPAETRSTGLGWALGIGRLGGILGPLLFGAAYSGGRSAGEIFFVMGALMAVCGVLVTLMGRLTRRQNYL